MIHLEHSIVIRSSLDKVYSIAERIEKFPEYMPHVKTSNIIKRRGNKRQVEMTAVVNGIKSHWISESVTEINKRIQYRQVKGLCKIVRGEWFFYKVPEGTKITLRHHFDVGWPIIGNLIGSMIIKKWVDKYSRLTLGAIKEKADQQMKMGIYKS
jgi:ribosome-associated toxin RatA of RatAB toxin-antitoxin module